MKRNTPLYAASVLCLLSQVAHAQSSVTLYGVLDAGIDYVSNQKGASPTGHSVVREQSGNLSTDRWGLKGSEDLGGGLSAIFTLENGFTINNGALANGGDEFGRQAWVGLASRDYGQLTLGRQYDFGVDFVAPLSATGSGFGGNIADHPFDNDNLNNDVRMNNSVKYVSRSYDGVRFGGAYAFSNMAGGNNNNSAFTGGLKYTYQGFDAAASYFQSNNSGGITPGQAANTGGALSSSDGDAILVGGRMRVYAAGVHYKMGPAAAGFVFSRSELLAPVEISSAGSYTSLAGNHLSFNNFELNGIYALTPALHLGGAYTYTLAHFDATGTSQSQKYSQVMLQADYSLSPRTDVYLEGVYRQAMDSGIAALRQTGIYTMAASTTGKQAVVAVGIRSRF